MELSNFELKNKITKSVIKNEAKLAMVARDCNIRLKQLQDILNEDEELNQFVKDVQFEYDTYLVDKAEMLLEEAMDQTSKGYANAVKICLFLLAHKGAERGYSKSGAIGSQAINKFELLDSLLSTDGGDSYKNEL
jgi:hypothetical protein